MHYFSEDEDSEVLLGMKANMRFNAMECFPAFMHKCLQIYQLS